jgi:D-glycero-D-manno-heptose 1,7-bisphosphate phosphatase
VKRRPAVFIDRDGTLITERLYLADPDGVEIIPGAVEAMKSLRDAGFALVIVTNQSGIARGLYTLDDYRAVARRLDGLLVDMGVPVDATEFCPHHPEVTGPCSCRKPDTGMHRRAAEEHGLDVTRSFFVGDKVSDVVPGSRLGGQGILVRTGYGRESEAHVPEEAWVVDDLAAAARRILGARGPAPEPAER